MYTPGKCSVPMWIGGAPSGECDEQAFGKYISKAEWRDATTGKMKRYDGKFNGYVPDLACEKHGGPSCPGIEIEGNIFSGCNQTGGDCSTCGK